MSDRIPLPTGWDREKLGEFADNLLLAVRPYASPHHALITLPGPEGPLGHDVDGLEGFARTFLLAGFRLKGENGHDPHGFAQWYAEGLDAGTNPDSPERWIPMDEHMQAKVEAASIAVILDMTRPWIWDQLEPRVQQQIIDYFSTAVGDNAYHTNNWRWFRLVVQTFLRSVGGPYSLEEMREDLAWHDSFARADGWMADGQRRSYDHYVGWALFLYPILWAQMRGAEDLAAERGTHDVEMLERYLEDALALIGADGAPLIQGRSLTYRFATAAPYWVGVLAGLGHRRLSLSKPEVDVPSVEEPRSGVSKPGMPDAIPMVSRRVVDAPQPTGFSLGQLRRAATGIVDYFVEHGAPDDRGILNLGWWHEWLPVAQSYSGPSSPYWAAKGLVGLALPADHPIWSTPEEPLPIERGDILRAIAAPGWLVDGTAADGIVRIINHGTDNSLEGDDVGDSAVYTRFGYSTATSPWMDEASWHNPKDQSVTLVAPSGRTTHRGGFTPLGVRIDNAGTPQAVGVGASRARVRFMDLPEQQDRVGVGYRGTSEYAATLTVTSIVRGGIEARVVSVDDVADTVPAGTTLRITGWPTVTGDNLTSQVIPISSTATASGTLEGCGVSPLGAASCVPYVDFSLNSDVVAAVICVTRADAPAADATKVAVNIEGGNIVGSNIVDNTIQITWPDAITTTTPLPGRSSSSA